MNKSTTIAYCLSQNNFRGGVCFTWYTGQDSAFGSDSAALSSMAWVYLRVCDRQISDTIYVYLNPCFITRSSVGRYLSHGEAPIYKCQQHLGPGTEIPRWHPNYGTTCLPGVYFVFDNLLGARFHGIIQYSQHCKEYLHTIFCNSL